MRTARSETTGRSESSRTAKSRWLLPTVAALAILTAVGVSPVVLATPKTKSVAASIQRVSAPLHHLHVTYTEQATGGVCAAGTHVFLVGTDEGSIAGRDRGFTSTLPCMSIERSCGANGTILVSSPGIHSCPDGTPSSPGVTGSCDGHSTGAFRFVRTTVPAVTQCQQPAPAILV
jgi:hypothetical protein